VMRIPISGPPVTPNQIAWLDRGLGCLRETGLEEGEKLSVILLLTGYVRSYATLEADLAEGAMASGSDPQAASSNYGRLLAKLTDAERFPALHTLVTSGLFEQEEPEDPNAEFAFGLERVLDGIDALVRARSRD
jgi:hypothetical protein